MHVEQPFEFEAVEVQHKLPFHPEIEQLSANKNKDLEK